MWSIELTCSDALVQLPVEQRVDSVCFGEGTKVMILISRLMFSHEAQKRQIAVDSATFHWRESPALDGSGCDFFLGDQI